MSFSEGTGRALLVAVVTLFVVMFGSLPHLSGALGQGKTVGNILELTFAATSTATTMLTITPYRPITGSVHIDLECDFCCCYCCPGLDVPVDFEASSPYGTVTEMRVVTLYLGYPRYPSTCISEDEMDDISWVSWEPFIHHKSYWVDSRLGPEVLFDVHVQYRDAEGYLSPIYCDWVHLTKGTATPTHTPTRSPTPTITPTGIPSTPTPLTPVTPLPTHWVPTPQAPAYVPLILRNFRTPAKPTLTPTLTPVGEDQNL